MIADHFTPIRHQPWERWMMRIGLAFLFYLATPFFPLHESISRPHGLAQWFDLTFLNEPRLVPWLARFYALGCVLYALGLGLPLVLPLLLAIHVGYATIANSQGAINHTSQVIALVMLIQWIVYLVAAWQKKHPPRGLSAPLNRHDLAIHFSLQAIAASYMVSVVSKLYYSGGQWLWQTPLMALQLQKARDMGYYNTLEEPAAHWTDTLARLVTDYPTLAIALFGAGILAELCAFGLFGARKVRLITGLALLGLHLSVSQLMHLGFFFHKALLILLAINPLYWLSRLGKRGSN